MGLVVRTLSDQLADVVRERILTGAVAIGEPIRQDALAGELGVSKIPLREALARLTRDGLLESQANRGFFVRPMSAQEAEEIYSLRLTIEPDAVVAGARAARPEDHAEAAAMLTALDMEVAMAGKRVDALNRAFHLALVRPGGGVVSDILERLHVLSERYVHKYFKPAGIHYHAHAEHHALLDAWRTGDAARMRGLTESHIMQTLSALRIQLALA